MAIISNIMSIIVLQYGGRVMNAVAIPRRECLVNVHTLVAGHPLTTNRHSQKRMRLCQPSRQPEKSQHMTGHFFDVLYTFPVQFNALGRRKGHVEGLVQGRRNSNALEMELRLSCTNLSCRPQMGPMLAPWTLLSGNVCKYLRPWPLPDLGFIRRIQCIPTWGLP